DDIFGDSSLDDEMIEAVRPGGLPLGDDRERFEPMADETEEIYSNGEQIENGAVESDHMAEEHETVKDFDWSPAARVVEDVKPEPTETTFEPRFTFSDTDPTVEIHASQNPVRNVAVAEPSD